MVKIVFSLTAHESVPCLDDLVQNILFCFSCYEVLILVSTTDAMADEFQNRYSNVRIVTRRPSNLPLWGKIHLFHQHSLNMKYLLDEKIPFDYFWFVASNEMFVRKIEPDFFEKFYPTLVRREEPRDTENYDQYWSDFYKGATQCNGWQWWAHMLRDDHFVQYIRKNKYKLYYGQHEGVVIDQTLTKEVYHEYRQERIHEDSLSIHYCLEEIFVQTYICNHYHVPENRLFTCCFWVLRGPIPDDLSKVTACMKEFHVSYKRVPRQYDDPLRIQIRRSLC